MAFSMGNQFSGLPMQDLIGAPLNAAADAQVRLANSTADFIQKVGFKPNAAAIAAATAAGTPIPFDPANFDVRTVGFKFNRATGPADDKGIVPTELVALEVPLLAIVKIPSLAIETVDIIFDMEVKNSEASKESEDKSGSFSADASVGWGPFSLKVHVEGSVASHKENTRSTDQTAKYHVEVHAADRGMPEGLARVLDMMNQSIAPKTIINDATKAAGGPAFAMFGPASDPADQPVLDHENDTMDDARVLTPGKYTVAA